mmetsp:Transcript_61082/g.160603  ORF Transcript_61082/g.160603 Transcript_61082/m.160603 type:complete len:595 (-) Transcript_61082:1003-2787(-)
MGQGAEAAARLRRVVARRQDHPLLHHERGGPRLRQRGHLLAQGSDLLPRQRHRGERVHLRHRLVQGRIGPRQPGAVALHRLRERSGPDHAQRLGRQACAHRHAVAVHGSQVGPERPHSGHLRHAGPAGGRAGGRSRDGHRAVLRGLRPPPEDAADPRPEPALRVLGGQRPAARDRRRLPHLLREHQAGLPLGLLLEDPRVRGPEERAKRARRRLLGHEQRREVHEVHQEREAHPLVRGVLHPGHEGRRLQRSVHHHHLQRHRQPGGLQVPPHRADARRDDELPHDRGVRGRGLHLDVPQQRTARDEEHGRRPRGRRGRRQREAQGGDDVPRRRVLRARLGPPRQGGLRAARGAGAGSDRVHRGHRAVPPYRPRERGGAAVLAAAPRPRAFVHGQVQASGDRGQLQQHMHVDHRHQRTADSLRHRGGRLDGRGAPAGARAAWEAAGVRAEGRLEHEVGERQPRPPGHHGEDADVHPARPAAGGAGPLERLHLRLQGPADPERARRRGDPEPREPAQGGPAGLRDEEPAGHPRHPHEGAQPEGRLQLRRLEPAPAPLAPARGGRARQAGLRHRREGLRALRGLPGHPAGEARPAPR